jgi:hypothetical protein
MLQISCAKTYGLLPRDIFVQAQNTGSLDCDDRRMLLDLLDVLKEAGCRGQQVPNWCCSGSLKICALLVPLTAKSLI